MATCGRCGTAVEEATAFCPACGSRLRSTAPAAPPPTASLPSTPTAPPRQYQATNGLAIASLVCGIAMFSGVGSILALVFGYMAQGQIDRSGGAEGGRGLATAGIVLGWVGVAVTLVAIVVLIAVASSV